MGAKDETAIRYGAELPLLVDAEVSLYPQNNDGTANTGAPVWLWCEARNLRTRREMRSVKTRTAGYAGQSSVTIGRGYTVSIDQLHLPPRVPGAYGELPSGKLVLDVLWNVRGESGWRRRTYYGVTIQSDELAPVDGMEFIEGLQMEAEDLIPDSGTGTPPNL